MEKKYQLLYIKIYITSSYFICKFLPFKEYTIIYFIMFNNGYQVQLIFREYKLREILVEII